MTELHLVIGNKNYSSWSMRPWIWLRHHDIEFNETVISLGCSDTAGLIRSHSAGSTVPVLVDGAVRIWDSLAILEYLAEKFPQKRGWPGSAGTADTERRAFARSVSAEMHSSFVALRTEMPMNCRRLVKNFKVSESVQADIDRIETLWNTCRANYGNGGPWLLGEYSIADAMYAPVVMRFKTYGVQVAGAAGEYVETVLQQSAVQEWIQAGIAEKEIIEAAEI